MKLVRRASQHINQRSNRRIIPIHTSLHLPHPLRRVAMKHHPPRPAQLANLPHILHHPRLVVHPLNTHHPHRIIHRLPKLIKQHHPVPINPNRPQLDHPRRFKLLAQLPHRRMLNRARHHDPPPGPRHRAHHTRNPKPDRLAPRARKHHPAPATLDTKQPSNPPPRDLNRMLRLLTKPVHTRRVPPHINHRHPRRLHHPSSRPRRRVVIQIHHAPIIATPAPTPPQKKPRQSAGLHSLISTVA